MTTASDGAGSGGHRRISMRLVAAAVGFAAAIGIGGGIAVHWLSARPTAPSSLPELHGQAVWSSGRRAAPDFSLRDQTGATVSLSMLRGRAVALTFLDSQCHAECPLEGRQLGYVLRRLPAAERPTLLVVSVDPKGDTPGSIRTAMTKWTLSGPWKTYWLTGSSSRLRAVWRAYGIAVLPHGGDIGHSLALYLIDRSGFERTAYLFPFLPDLVRGDLARLSRESSA